jgi:purine-binding chemotaxis protein CheW
MKTDTRSDTLLEQQLALGAYFDALLTGVVVPEEQPVDLQPKAEVKVSAVAKDSEPEPVESEVPEWARTRFQVLLFEVAGLTLGVPLAKLKGVVPNEHGLTEMPGHSPLFLGVTPYQGMQAKVMDTARFVLPQNRAALLTEDISERSGHLVVIDEGRWALACSKIGDVVELEPGQVKWRTASGKRRWLAGTAIELMCALLDIDELTEELVSGMA